MCFGDTLTATLVDELNLIQPLEAFEKQEVGSMLNPLRKGYHPEAAPAPIRLPAPSMSPLSRGQTLEPETFALDQDWQARIDRLFDNPEPARPSTPAPAIVAQDRLPTSSVLASTLPLGGAQPVAELKEMIKKLRGEEERLQEALWKKATREIALQKEVEALKETVRSLQGAPDTSVKTGIWHELEDKFDREAVVELQNYLVQSTQALRAEFKDRRT
jgi:hypothetical protein